jgi:hypothetical protein
MASGGLVKNAMKTEREHFTGLARKSWLALFADPKLLLTSAVILLAAPAVLADDGTISGSEDASKFGTLPQDADGIKNPAGACGPTAAIDSLTYLANTHPGLFKTMTPAQLDTAPQVNAMQTDMWAPNPVPTDGTGVNLTQMVHGKTAYLINNPTTLAINVNATTWEDNGQGPGAEASAKALAQLLQAGQDVELEVTPLGGGQGHIDILTGITWNPATGSGTASLVDPLVEVPNENGPPTTDPFKMNISANSGYLNIPIGGTGTDGEGNTVSAENTGNITGYVEECVQVKPNPAGCGRAGSNSPQMQYDATTGTLSFTDSTINFANLIGDTSSDPQFASDPVMGATVHYSDFTLAGPQGTGYLFTGGSVTISNGSQTLLSADVPELLLEDDATSVFGLNLYAPMYITYADEGLSPFISDYLTTAADDGFLAELMGTTSIPVDQLIASDESFTTSVEGMGTGTCVPEPSTLVLVGSGIIGLMARRRRAP